MGSNWMKRLHVTIEGHVQGVGFRYFVLDQASGLELTGWVRNTWDGKVEVIAEGDQARLERLLSALNRGPRGADVTRVNTHWLPASGEFSGFRVKQTTG